MKPRNNCIYHCALCKKEIKEKQALSPLGNDTFAHSIHNGVLQESGVVYLRVKNKYELVD